MIQAVKSFSDGRRPEIAVLAAALVIMAVCCALPFVLPREPAGVVLLVGVLGTQLLAYTAYFRLHMYEQTREGGARWREPRPIYAITVAGALFALPATITGAVDLDTPGMPDLVLLLLAGAITILLGRLGTILVWMPVELLIRGVAKMAKGERGSITYFLGAGGGLVLVGFAVSGAAAVDMPRSPSQPGFQREVLAALFGVSGDYTGVNPELLVVARVFGAILLLVLLMGFAGGVVAFVRRIVTGLASSGESTARSGGGSGPGARPEDHGVVGSGVRNGDEDDKSGASGPGRGQGWTGKLY